MKKTIETINRVLGILVTITVLPGLALFFIGPLTESPALFEYGLILVAIGFTLSAINLLVMGAYPIRETPVQLKTWTGVPMTIHRWEQLSTGPIALFAFAALFALAAFQEELGLSTSQAYRIAAGLILIVAYAIVGSSIIKGRIVLRYIAINGWWARMLGGILLVGLTLLIFAYWGSGL